jgi:RHS repeat-associated protein
LTGRYLHGEAVDQIFAEEVNGQTRWTLTDHLGSVRDVVSDTGVTLGRITYDSFGLVANTTGIVDTLFRYTARPGLATTGFYDYRARVYDPRIGQFLSEDPIGFTAGDPNLRRYVGNEPTRYTDPSGLERATFAHDPDDEFTRDIKRNGGYGILPDSAGSSCFRSGAQAFIVSTGVGIHNFLAQHPEIAGVLRATGGAAMIVAGTAASGPVLMVVLLGLGLDQFAAGAFTVAAGRPIDSQLKARTSQLLQRAGVEKTRADQYADWVETLVLVAADLAALLQGRGLSGRVSLESPTSGPACVDAVAPTARTERLTTRAEEVHSVLDSIARKQRTTAVLETSGGDIIGGGARDLTPAQRATLRPGEIEARLPGEHAEITALQEAARRGLRPRAIVTTRDFCPDCRRVLEEAGARITGPRTAVWD